MRSFTFFGDVRVLVLVTFTETLERARRMHGQRPGDAHKLCAFHALKRNAPPGGRPAPDTSSA
jgi:hypothetical protein